MARVTTPELTGRGAHRRDQAGRARRQSVRRLRPRWGGLATVAQAGSWSGRAGTRRWRTVRRLLALSLVAAAGWSAAAQTPADPGSAVLTVVHDLSLGALLTTADLVISRVDKPPDGALTAVGDAVGRSLSAPTRRGEILTDLRLVPAEGPDAGPGRQTVAVRPADPALAQVLHPGMTVAVVGLSATGTAVVISAQAVVLAVLPAMGGSFATVSPPILLGVPDSEADQVTAATLAGDIALRIS